MRTISTFVAAPLILVLGFSTPSYSQERHVVAPADLASAVTQHAVNQDADRAAIHEALTRPEVRAVAEQAGVNIERIAASVDSLDASTLARAAASAHDVNSALVGGASTVTISTTTIIIVLLIVILILVAD